MGINGLMSFLREKHPEVFLGRQAVQGIAYVDTPLIVMSCGMVAISSHATIDPYALLIAKLQSLTQTLFEIGVSEVRFVFDGPTRPEKVKTCIKRQDTIHRAANKRKRGEPAVQLPGCAEVETQTYSVFETVSAEHALCSDLYIASMNANDKDVGMLKDLSKFAKAHLERNGVCVVVAPHDSESFIASQVTPNDVAVTVDSDALPFGCKLVAHNVGTPKEEWIRLSDVLTAVNMDLHTFQVFCVMLGTDFNPRLPLCGPVKALQCIKTFTCFDDYCTTNAPKNMTVDEKKEWIQQANQSLQVFLQCV
jgi:5'-3' exonuclease